MKVNAKQIIDETVAIFEKSGAGDIYRNAKHRVEDEDYRRLHPSFLTPLDIKIDPKLFNEQIKEYEQSFEQWGNDHQQLPRYGLALVNQDGVLKNSDPINGSLMAWNRDNPTQPLIETDCVVPTKVLNLSSLNPLRVFDGHWCRSNVFKWNNGAFFYPHIDTIVPSLWIRLWATTSPDVVVRYYDATTERLVEVNDIELGRIYVIDTSIVHDAYATNDNVYQLFLSVVPSASGLITQHTK